MRTLVDVLLDRADEGPALAFGDDARTGIERADRALRVAGTLQRHTDPGDRVLLVFLPGLDFVDALLGCFVSGRIAVPVYPPDPRRGTAVLDRIARDCGARVGLGLPVASAPHLALDDGPAGRVTPGDVALLQYTSGSTGDPKGVVITHANLMHNQAAIQEGARTGPDDRIVSWLPTYHDMGLIGTVLHALFVGAPCTLLSPLDFLQEPRRWLQAISDRGGTYSLAPTFAYALCTRKVTRLDGLDLSSWRYAGVGAEPVHARVLREFVARFADVGFRASSLAPLYGLAENTVGVTAKADPDAPPRVRHFDDHGELVSMGTWRWGGQALRIVDGEIVLRSPSVASGYWNDRHALGEWLHTGDLGFVHEGELYVLGRRDDRLVVRGRNLGPHDLEATAERVPGVRGGCSAAFAVDGEVVLVIEGSGSPTDVASAVRAAHGVDVEVCTAPRGGVPKTSSGKVRRGACRDLYVQGAWRVDPAWLAEQLGVRPQPDVGFAELGLDSVQIVEGSATLARALGRALPPTLLFDHGTLRKLAAHLHGRATPHVAPDPAGAVAIAGIGCRLPGGVEGADGLWRALCDGLDAITDPPRAEAPRQAGGYLDDPFGFDFRFFGLGPREARSLDPQQRLLLEVTWHALEDAGLSPWRLRGSRTGVFVGASGHEHAARRLLGEAHDAYTLTGSLGSALAGRLAWFHDWHGPALTVDTACSSSLVAAHLAVQSLRAGECDLAVVAGVNVLLSDGPSQAFAALGALSATGRCRPFGADADGIVRSEGCVAVVLRRGDGIARIVGSATNHDGRTAALTAPSGAAQEAVLRAAGGRGVGVVEAHGTGTPLGDPIEARAIRAVYGAVPVGSAKSNFGHLEAAAGVLGLAKAALMVQHRVVPPSLHGDPPNPLVELEVVGEARPLQGAVGVSAFGFSGTNAHVVVDAAPDSPSDAGGPRLAFVSGATPAAFAANARRLATLPDDPAVCRMLARRAHHAVRACVPLGTEALVGHTARRVAWVFGGQGVQPGSQLDRFDAAMARVDALRALGLEPDVVLGHSLGQLAAATVAGVFDREVARDLVQERQRLMDVPGQGAMLAVRGRPEALPPGVEIAVDAGPDLVLSGPLEAIEAAEMALADRPTRRLEVADAFHSARMDPAVAPFVDAVRRACPRPPTRPLVAHGDVTDPAYWGRHLRETVRWADALAEVADAALLVVEAPLAQQVVLAWEAGHDPDLASWVGDGPLAHVPGYAFERPDPADPGGWVWEVRADPAGRVWVPVPRGPSPLTAGRYLVTGGTGGLGTLLADYLEDRHGAEVVRLGRGMVDLTDATATAAWARGQRFDAVFHLAGQVDGSVKREGLEHLHGVLETPRWVLFSSIAGVLELSRGLEGYAEANRWLDAWAAGRDDAVSIAWPPWDAPGMASRIAEHLDRRGIRPIDPVTAMAALEVALGSGLSNVVVLHREAGSGPLPADAPARVRAAVAATAGRALSDDERFAAAGIDSVAALGLLRDLEGALGRQLPSTFLFENDTVGAVLTALEGSGELEVAAAAVPEGDVLPYTPTQRAFVAASRYFADQANSVVIGCDTQVDVAAALPGLLARHPILTACLRPDGLEPGAATVRVERVDRVDDDAIARQPFDPERPFRVVTDDRRVVLAGHHALVDAQSIAIALADLLSPGPDPASSWADALPHLSRPASPGTVAWWRETLAPVPPLPLPWRAPVDAPPTDGCAFERRTVPLAPLQRLAASLDVTVPVLLLALWGRFLYRQTGLDPVIRVALGHRDLRVPDVDRVIGCFADGLPLKVPLVRELRDLCAEVARRLADVVAHSDLGAQELAGLVRGDPGAPVGVSPLGFSFPRHALPDGLDAVHGLRGSTSTGFVRLSLLAWPLGDVLHLTFCRSVSHLDQAWLAEHADGFVVSLDDQRPAARTLHGAVLSRLGADPGRNVMPGWTAAALDEASARVAATVDAGDRVAVVAYPAPETVAMLLGVLRAGGVVVPLDAAWPRDRRVQLAELAGVAAVLERVPDGPAARVDVDADTAFVWFTSGSTGRPKGVVVGHRAALDFLDQAEVRFAFGPDDVFLHCASIAFDASLRQVFSPLLAGAELVTAGPEIVRDPGALAERCAEHGVTVFNTVPGLFGAMPPMPSVRLVLVGGEALPAGHVARWTAQSDAPVFNMYGTTETVVNATAHRATPGDTAIGFARAGVHVTLLDGEIVVSGSIADGYLHGEPGFEDHPRLGRIYRTGDRARRRSDGALEFLGRADRQVQVRGHRVELGEVERVLLQHTGVRAADVSLDDGRLVATIEGETALRAWCAERLPTWMVPHRFRAVAALPRGPTGKVARGVAAVWQRVLGLAEAPEPDDDFFALGGDSMSLLEVADAVGVRPMRLYGAPRLADMQRLVDPARTSATEPVAGGPSEVERGFLTVHARGGHPTAAVRLPWPHHDVATLQARADALVRRHPRLRCAWRDGQRVACDVRVVVQHDDLRRLGDGLSWAREQLWQLERATRFDPDQPPLVRVRLCRLPEGAELILTADHLVCDAWSTWILARELRDGVPDGVVPVPPEPRRPDDPWWRAQLADLSDPPRQGGVGRYTFRAMGDFVTVLRACFGALAEALGTEDLCVSTAVAGRTSATRDVVGAYAWALPVRIRHLGQVDAAFSDACAHSDASLASIVAAGGPTLGRFFLTWLEPPGDLPWSEARSVFATRSTGTELMVAVTVRDGLTVRVYGSALAERVGPLLQAALCPVSAAIVGYGPPGVYLPVTRPTVVETVATGLGRSELVLLPFGADAIPKDPRAAIDAALEATDAPVVSLAGMLPSLTGLAAAQPVGRVLTTGHAATVVAMVLTTERALLHTGRRWADCDVGVVGYGSIGRATLALLRHRHGEPRRVTLTDPRLPASEPVRGDLLLGASSGGATLDVAGLAPGTLVIDDSFPPLFDHAAARARMVDRGDVLLIGGGTLDAGPLHRTSTFPEAQAARDRFGARWLAGCHAEAVLVAAYDLGPTRGPVTVARALAMLRAVRRAGWGAPPLHLGTWEVPTKDASGPPERSGGPEGEWS